LSEAIVPRTVGQTATKEPAERMTDGQTDRLRASAALRTDDQMWPRNVEAGRGAEAVEAVAGFWARYMAGPWVTLVGDILAGTAQMV
jgi:hypothetical protein